MNIYALELTRIPRASLKVLLRLAKTLRRDAPAQTNAIIDEALAELDAKIAATHAAMVARYLSNNPGLTASEAEFDWAVDGLWVLLNRGLEGAQAYAHRGLDKLSDERAEAVDLPGLREHALAARRVQSLLFGATNMASLVRVPFIEQVETMADILRVIEDQKLEAEIEQVVGPRLLPLLSACQAEYEAMVDDRLSRQRGAAINLATLRNELRVFIVNYATAVHSLFSPSKPESGQVVLDALRSILTLRELATRAGASASGPDLDEELDGDFVEIELPASVDEETAQASE